MVYCVKYSKCRFFDESYESYESSSPYEDWINRGQLEDTLFGYDDRYGPHRFSAYMLPANNLIYLCANTDGDQCEVFIRVKINLQNRSVAIDNITCSNHFYYSQMHLEFLVENGEVVPVPENGQGGYAFYRTSVYFMDIFKFSLPFKRVIERFFGNSWTAKKINTRTIPRISDEDQKLLKTCEATYITAINTKNYPGACLIGYYDMTRSDSATVIQKHFRGWTTRLRTAFNPNTTIGKYYALKSYRELVSVSV
jgi:hypothetical protein